MKAIAIKVAISVRGRREEAITHPGPGRCRGRTPRPRWGGRAWLASCGTSCRSGDSLTTLRGRAWSAGSGHCLHRPICVQPVTVYCGSVLSFIYSYILMILSRYYSGTSYAAAGVCRPVRVVPPNWVRQGGCRGRGRGRRYDGWWRAGRHAAAEQSRNPPNMTTARLAPAAAARHRQLLTLLISPHSPQWSARVQLIILIRQYF